MEHSTSKLSNMSSSFAKSLFLKLPTSQLPHLSFPTTPVSPGCDDQPSSSDEDTWSSQGSSSPEGHDTLSLAEPPATLPEQVLHSVKNDPRDIGQMASLTPNSDIAPHSSPRSSGDELSFAAIQALGYDIHPWLLARYDIVEELGAGGYGVVVRGISKCRRHEVAIKILWRNKMGHEHWIAVRGWDPKLLTTAILVPKEAFILRQVAHPGVIGYVDLLEDEKFTYLVMEYFGSVWNPTSIQPVAPDMQKLEPFADANGQCPHTPSLQPREIDSIAVPPRPIALRRASTDLFECLEQAEHLPEEICKFIFRQLASTILHLHKRGVVHCDLKDENIVIDKQYRVKIIDFGSAQMLDPTKPAPFHQKFRGTINFAPPEVLKGQMFQAPQAEVWALGCILSVLLTGKGPFASADAAIRGQISEPINPLPAQAFDLMTKCLRVDANERFNICQVSAHPWLN